jgi:hypothetical protein
MCPCQVRILCRGTSVLVDPQGTVSCWPTPSNDGTCLVNIEYELENDSLILHDVVVSIPLPYVSLP